MSWTLRQIWIYPFKSLPGLMVDQSEILPAGNLRHDREFALVDAQGGHVNAKRTAAIHRIRAEWDLNAWQVSLFTADSPDFVKFHLKHDQRPMAEWLSQEIGIPVQILQREEGSFPDDEEAFGPTVVTTESIREVATWFPGLSLQEIRSRFRANLELDGSVPFSEDRLFAAADDPVEFRIGEAILLGTNPCQRCVVPTRSSQTGEIYPSFQKTFAERRQKTLPDWADRSRFNHFYRLTVNTRSAKRIRQRIRVGDEVKLENG